MPNPIITQVQIGEQLYDLMVRGLTTDYYTTTHIDETFAPLISPNFEGTPTAPTVDISSTTAPSTQLATIGYVQQLYNANDVMVFMGVVDSQHGLPEEDYEVGWTYKVGEGGTYAGKVCEAGDTIICVDIQGDNSDWAVLQANIDGAVTGPASSVENQVAIFDGISGKIIKDSGKTIGESVPEGAVFTDHLYEGVEKTINVPTAGAEIEAVAGVTWDAGSAVTLGTEIAATEVKSWNQGSLATFESVTTVTGVNWTDGVAPSYTTATVVSGVTYTAGELPSLTVSGEVLTFNAGSAASLVATTTNVKEVESVGSMPSLSVNEAAVSHMTAEGVLPSLSTEAKSIPNVTDAGEAPSLVFTTTNIPNITVSTTTVIGEVVSNTTLGA